MSLINGYARVQTALVSGFAGVESRTQELAGIRQDRVVWLIVVAVAVVIALGLATAWFVYCQSKGGWPALDMPSFSSGGTWKLYCAK